ncbi:response regulator [Halorubrum sp. CBA1125]|uniref:response regulator transcription factor n=1 Tax=Halorubrum sp. CBA1125 TaxID=2668072 RepID=UPI0012E90D1D|nr:response regulator [Halorubrum sp. CBA1125]MUW14190.1 response regulator [Halorubrum sp. CBA1125]
MGANSRHPSDGASVLIVEDERDLAELYDTWLSDSYETEVAYSGTEAQERFDEGRHEVVLLDRWLPDISGDEVLETIRDREPNGKVAMLTGVSPDFDVIEMEVDSYVLKPVTRDELRELVDRLRHLAEYQRDVQELYPLIAKRTVLESEKTADELAVSEEFATLTDQIATKKERSRASIEATDNEDVRTLLKGEPPRKPREHDR